MVPSTYEDGTLYNVLPSGNKAPDETGNHNGYDQTRADFTFSRGSNLAATRVNSDGLIEKGRENLLLQSNQFDTTWTTSSASVTSGQSGYDGSSDAWLLTATNTFNRVQQSISVSGVKRFSVYAKANTNDYLLLGSFEGAHYYATFNLATGAVDSNNANVKAVSIEDVGNGWYRCSATWISTTTQIRIGSQNASGQGAWATTTSGSIFIQNAQLEKGLVSTPYIATGSTTAQAGILEDMPRINYDANGENGALLLESSRTNILAYSEGMFDSSNFIKINGVVAEGQQTDLNGTNTAVKLSNFVQSAARLDYNTAVAAVDGKTYTYSAYYKGSGDIRINVSTSTGVGGSGEKTITLTDEWVRHSITATFSSPTGNVKSHLAITRTANNDAEVYLCFAQIEEGSYPSSYIPTHGAAVTRGADSCSVTGVSDVIGQSEGTIYAEIEKFANGYWYLTISDGTSSNWVFIGEDLGKMRGYVRTSGGVQTDNRSADLSVGVHKMAIAYKLNDVAIYLDGTQVFTDSSANMPSTLNKISLTAAAAAVPANQTLKAELKQYALFDTRLTNSELATLTTL